MMFLGIGLKSYFTLLLVSLFCLSFSSGLEFGLSPSEIIFDLNVNQEKCSEILLKSDLAIRVNVSDRWSEIGVLSRDLNRHNLSSDELGLKLEYKENYFLNKTGEYKLCVDSKKEGIYHGVILFNSGSVGIGSWMVLNVSSKNKGITGMIIEDYGNSRLLNQVFISFILVVVLFILILRLKKKL